MTWLIEKPVAQVGLRDRFLRLANAPGTTMVPGCHDALTALLARQAGFDVLYLSGAGYAASRGLPDLGLTTGEAVAERVRDIVRATELPLLVDVDTGFGGILECARTGREMVEAGAAAVQIEDQQLPKKCGHLSGKRLAPVEEVVEKIRTLRETAPTLAIVARTDALAVEGLDAAVKRARAYCLAGADMVFPEALEIEQQFQRFRDAVSVPLLVNLTEFGRTPLLDRQRVAELGYGMAIYPLTALRVAARAMQETFRELIENGTQRGLLGRMQTRRQLYDLIRYEEYEALDGRIAHSVLPGEERQADRGTE